MIHGMNVMQLQGIPKRYLLISYTLKLVEQDR